MRPRLRPIALVMALVLGVLLVAACTAEDDGTGASDDQEARTISISGEGRVALAPDLVMMSLGVDIGRPELAEAQAEATETMDAVIAALRDAGIGEVDIQTATYAIYLERDYTRTGSPVTGYRVVHLVTVKARDIDSAGATLQAAIDAGANNVQSVWFALEDTMAAIRQARELAVTDARDKASELARLAGEELGDVLKISEGVSVPTTPEYRDGADVAPGAGVTINPGQTEVIVSVSMVWEID